MGLAIMIIGLAVFLGAHTFTTMRTAARGADRAHRARAPTRASIRWCRWSAIILIG